LSHHKPWFNEELLGYLDQRNQAKIQLVRTPSQSNVDNINNVRTELIRYFRKRKKKYLRAKFEEHETYNKIKKLGTCT
jgi:hypothetical protein